MTLIVVVIAVAVVFFAVFFITGKYSGLAKKKEKPLAEIVKEAFKDFKESLFFKQELSYEEAMKYIIAHKNDAVEIVKGAMLKETVAGGFRIVYVFLDKENKLVEKDGHLLGCAQKTSRLDKELLDVFGDEDLIIVE